MLRSRVPASAPTPTVLHWLRRYSAQTPDAPKFTVAADTGRRAWSYAQA
ncbi:hypothetical protein [Streptomyces hokutonensis]|uniref:Uncharacterized protein n=1 Tax=Streptomyces hokutonensis TaxID=1306990 RepID=A0ABW6M7M6_9ACTN